MKLLIDENLSPGILKLAQGVDPDSLHVHDVELGQCDDRLIWEFARENGFVVISKDSDLYELSLVLGHPPKLIWIRLGNCSTRQIVDAFTRHASQLEDFLQDDTKSAFLLL